MAFERQEFERIYRRCFARAMSLAVSLLHDDEDARDVVQEVFTRLWERSMTIDSPDAFIYRSVRNACLNRIELMTTRERILRTLPIDEDPSESLSQDRLEAVRKAAEDLLTGRENEVIREIFTDGHSYREAASSLGVTTSAINKHIVNALRKLRNHLNPRKL